MNVQPIKTHIVNPGEKITDILNAYITGLNEKSILAITSKIVSLSENRIIPISDSVNKRDLIHQEADLYWEDPEYYDKYHISLTIKDDNLIASSGIDESNGNGYYILWPKNPYATAAYIWKFLKDKFHLEYLGIIITDSHTTPVRWGITGTTLSWCGFEPLNDYVGKPDLFGRPFKFEKTSVRDCLASAAVLVMGEGNEQTPMALMENLPFIQFTNHPPTQTEIQELHIDIKDDIYAPLLTSVQWQKRLKT